MEQIVIYLLMVKKFINLWKMFWNYSNFIMSRKHFKRLFVNNVKDIELNWYVYDWSVDYDAIAIVDILDIQKYLMKKNKMI